MQVFITTTVRTSNHTRALFPKQIIAVVIALLACTIFVCFHCWGLRTASHNVTEVVKAKKMIWKNNRLQETPTNLITTKLLDFVHRPDFYKPTNLLKIAQQIGNNAAVQL
jgi:hypothetical protein